MNDNPDIPIPIRVLLVDDHSIVRQGLKQLLESDSRVTVCAEAANGEEAISDAFLHKPDIILMDVNLPKINGYEATRAILTAWPEARILVLTNQDDLDVLKKFMSLDIKGYALKDIDWEDLIAALFTIMAGEKLPVTAELSEKLETLKSTAHGSGNPDELTDREREVLLALTKGYSNQQLADLLMVSPKTVHNHLYNIYSKIRVGTRAEAIVWAIESGFTRNR